ncbi:ATP-dependent DNA helicase PIF1 [Trifolium pratense]|uniref:ATP-dependent DNA helicase n=1 Tax=Trifolium pratense TaxID=57577 RepID=A0A2K3K383_TRIPR|nr:ATP-dependent DNA helicase PIF1 [Trifolium pratense]
MSAALRTKGEIVLTVVSSGIAVLLILVVVDRTLKDILQKKEKKNFPFGGKAVVLGGDFRQILPVIPKGTRQEVVNSTIYSSRFCEVLTLTTRLQTGSSDSDIEDEKNFSDWILGIGDGSIGQSNDSDITIQIPPNLLVPNLGDPLSTIVQSTYPDLFAQYE